MASDFGLQGTWGWELFVVLGTGATMLVALAAVVSRWAAAPRWQAATWRIATLSLLVLCLFEFTGVGQAVVRLCRQRGMGSLCGQSSPQSADTIGHGAGAEGSVAFRSAKDCDFRGANGNSGTVVASSVPESQSTATLDRQVHPASSDGPGGPSYAPRSEAASDSEDNVNHSAEVAPISAASPNPVHIRWLAAVWAAGTSIGLVWLIGGRIAAWIFRRRCIACDDETILARIASLKATLGIRRAVAVLKSPRVAAPVVLGGWRPALVLPLRFSRDFNAQQQAAILAHELAHLVSRDSAWQSAALLACGLVWWHPLVWWSRRQLRAATEAAADEASLTIPDGPRILAEALVLLGRRLLRIEPRVGLSLGGSHFRSHLGRRVERL